MLNEITKLDIMKHTLALKNNINPSSVFETAKSDEYDSILESIGNDIDKLNEEFNDELFTEASRVNPNTKIVYNNLYPIIKSTLDISRNNAKFKQIVSSFIDQHTDILHAPGPSKQLVFGDIDKNNVYNLFNLNDKSIRKYIDEVLQGMNSLNDFKLLKSHPEYWLFTLIVIYYTEKKDDKGLNCALALSILADYSAVYRYIFKYDPRPDVMDYTVEHLTNKFLIKKSGNLFGGLMLSIQSAYSTLKDDLVKGTDAELIRYIQRVRNSDKDMMKNIMDAYMINYKAGNKNSITKDKAMGIAFDDDVTNNTTAIQIITENIVSQLMTNGLDLKRISTAKSIGNISMADCRFYLSKIITTDNVESITKFIEALLFIYLYEEKNSKSDINSMKFLQWSLVVFKKTNANNPNVVVIKETLNKWSEDVGINRKFKSDTTRINYKKALFMYFILSIQNYNQ